MADRERIIKGLEHCINEEDCEGCVYYDDYYNKMKEQHSGNKCQCFLDTVALLKEQEPKLPLKKQNAYGIHFYLCPKCAKVIFYTVNTHYCERCGQAVKWE